MKATLPEPRAKPARVVRPRRVPIRSVARLDPQSHQAFGMWADVATGPAEQIRSVRRPRG